MYWVNVIVWFVVMLIGVFLQINILALYWFWYVNIYIL